MRTLLSRMKPRNDFEFFAAFMALLAGALCGICIGSVILSFTTTAGKLPVQESLVSGLPLTLGLILGVFGVLLILACVHTSAPDANSYHVPFLLDSEGQVTKRAALAYWIWPWQKLPRTALVPYLPCHNDIIAFKVNPITENPKVLKLQGKVRVYVSFDLWEIKQYLESDSRAAIEKEGLRSYLQRQLRELAYHHSREFAKFYNDYDKEQQRQFSQFIWKHLQPLLPGFNLRSACFTVQ